MFIGGCGRFFEGTAEQMCAAFDQLAQLPDDTVSAVPPPTPLKSPLF